MLLIIIEIIIVNDIITEIQKTQLEIFQKANTNVLKQKLNLKKDKVIINRNKRII